jgi:NADPH2:quinone reductase
MKAILLCGSGSLDDAYLGEIDKPAPSSNEILIEVAAAGVNPADWKIVEMGFPGWEFPKAIGLDAAGIVVEVGRDVGDFEPGQRVYYHGRFSQLGAYAEFALAPDHVVAPIPDSVSFDAAAATPTAGYTAYQVVHDRLHLTAEDTVLIHAGAGGVGGFAIQLAKLQGATVITTCSSANAAYVKKLGADHVIDYRDEDVSERLLELTKGRGVDAIVDVLGSSANSSAVGQLAFQGHLVCCAGLPDLAVLQPLPRGIRITDIALGGAYLSGDRRAQERLAYYGRQMAGLLASGSIDPMVSEIVDLDQAIEALRRNKAGHQRGKLVIRTSCRRERSEDDV